MYIDGGLGLLFGIFIVISFLYFLYEAFVLYEDKSKLINELYDEKIARINQVANINFHHINLVHRARKNISEKLFESRNLSAHEFWLKYVSPELSDVRTQMHEYYMQSGYEENNAIELAQEIIDNPVEVPDFREAEFRIFKGKRKNNGN